eukprot:365272-Chlamydomonas_euryale.AAC.13
MALSPRTCAALKAELLEAAAALDVPVKMADEPCRRLPAVEQPPCKPATVPGATPPSAACTPSDDASTTKDNQSVAYAAATKCSAVKEGLLLVSLSADVRCRPECHCRPDAVRRSGAAWTGGADGVLLPTVRVAAGPLPAQPARPAPARRNARTKYSAAAANNAAAGAACSVPRAGKAASATCRREPRHYR